MSPSPVRPFAFWRRLLARWWTINVLLVGGLLGDVLLVPFSYPADQWVTEALVQLSALWQGIMLNPLLAVIIALIMIGANLAGWYASVLIEGAAAVHEAKAIRYELLEEAKAAQEQTEAANAHTAEAQELAETAQRPIVHEGLSADVAIPIDEPSALEVGDKSTERSEMHDQAMLDAEQGKVVEARGGYERALQLAQELGDKNAERSEVHALAVLDAEQGKVVEARGGFERALQLAQELGDQRAEAVALTNLGAILGELGEPGQSIVLNQQALAIAETLGDHLLIGHCHRVLAGIAEDQRDIVTARQEYELALVAFERISSPVADLMRQCLTQLDDPIVSQGEG